MTRARTVAEVIAGEAVSGTPEQRMADMRNIASVIANRAALLGVTPEQVVSSGEFDAYGGRLPPGVGADIVAMAQEAVDDVAANGPVNNATFYSTPETVDNLPGRLSFETATTGHQFFSDPHGRAIGTSLGYREPNTYAYAQNPANVPAPASKGFLNPWGDMAAAGPMTAPMGSVVASGYLGAPQALEASTRANPMLSLPATADLGMTPGFDASSLASLDTPSSRMGITEPGFDMSRFDGAAPAVSADFDQGRFADPEMAAFDASRFGTPSIDPATNITGFLDQPSQLGSMPDAYAAQRGPSTGLLSADAQAVQGLAEKQMYDQANADLPASSLASAYTAAPTVTPAEQAIADQTTAAGFLGANPGLAASATVPSLPGSMTPSQVAGYQQMAAAAPNITNLSGVTGIFDDGTGFQTSVPSIAQIPDLQQADEPAPDLETVDVPDQPTVAGPATTPAEDQQQTTPSTVNRTMPTKTAPSFADRMKAAINPGTAIGAAIGGGFLGVPGAIAGGFLGNAVNQGGFLNKPMSINNIGGGYDAVTSVWSGGQPVGTQATASDGQRITSLPGGLIGVTNSAGITTGFDSSGKAYSVWGGVGDDQDQDTEGRSSGGGFFGGLFG